MTIDLLKARAWLILLIVSGYIILNQGFMLLRLPPGSGFGVPIGEILILLFAVTFLFELKRLPSFAAIAPIVPLLLWWSDSIIRALLHSQQYGIWALRDASHAIDSLFIWIGFVVAAAPGFFNVFSKWFRILLNVGVLYALTYPFRETLTAWSPKQQAPAGYREAIFFNYISAALVPLTAATRWLVDRVNLYGVPAVVLAGAIIAYSVVIFQMRTTYLQILALMLVMAVVQPRVVLRMSGAMIIGFAALALLLASGLEITGRLGEKFSIDFLLQHIAAIWGEEGSGAIAEAAGGVGQRLRWWSIIWQRLNADLGSLLFGLGYGMPLTDFYFTGGIRVREPHNSVISVLARNGIIGLAIFVWLHLALLGIWMRAYRLARRIGNQLWANNFIIIGVYILLVWVLSMGEDALEKPYNAISLYFFWGVILRAYFEMRTPGGRLYSDPAGLQPAVGEEDDPQWRFGSAPGSRAAAQKIEHGGTL